MPDSAISAHPSQPVIWRIFDRVMTRKLWASHLEVGEPEISRWSTGGRPMSHDDIKACLSICRAVGHRDQARRVVRALVADYTEALGEDGPPAQVDPVSTALAAGRAAGDACAVIERALADDGVVHGAAEADQVETAAAALGVASERMHELARQARRPRVVGAAR